MTQAVTGLPFPIASLTCLTLEQRGSEGSHIFSQSICRTSFHGRNLKSLLPWKERLDEEHLVLILLRGGVFKCTDEMLIEKRWFKWKKEKFVNSSFFVNKRCWKSDVEIVFFTEPIRVIRYWKIKGKILYNRCCICKVYTIK